MKKKILLLAAVLNLMSALSAEVKVRTEKEGVWIENSLFSLLINPEDGARGVKFIDKESGKDWIQDDGTRGLFIDHFWQEQWPGQFFHKKYSFEIKEPGPGRAVVSFKTLSHGDYKGFGEQAGNQMLQGLELEKTVTVCAGSPAIDVKIRVTNTEKKGRLFGYWMQNNFFADGDRENDVHMKPGPRGIGTAIKGDRADEFGNLNMEWERSPTAGFTATVDKKSGKGFVFLVDYNELMWLYNCIDYYTTEYQFDKVALPAGKVWATDIRAVFLRNTERVSYASGAMTYSVKCDEKPDSLGITYALQSNDGKKKSVEISFKARELISGVEYKSEPQKIDVEPLQQKTIAFSRPEKFDEQIVITTESKVSEDGKAVTNDSFETFFGGNLGFAGQNRTLEGQPIYSMKGPAKTKKIIKPDSFQKLVDKKLKILFIKGPTGFDFITPAARDMKAELVSAEVKGGGSFPPYVSFFPIDYEELMSFDVIVLMDVSAEAIGVADLEKIKDFVEAGGSLLVFAGPYSFAGGDYAGTYLEKMLPVEVGKPFSIRKAADPLIVFDPKFEKSAVFEGINLEDKVACPYYMALKVKDGAEIYSTCDKQPLIIAGKYSKGKTVVMLMTHYGQAAEGSVPYWQWKDYMLLNENILRYLNQ